MAHSIGLDLGTSYVRIIEKSGKILLRCPSAVAIDSRDHHPVAVGSEARKMLGKTPRDILAYRPIRDGFVSEFEATVLLLQALFRNKNLCSLFNRPTVLLSVPYRINQVQQYASENAVFESGARSVAQIPAVFAAAAGAGLRVSSPRGCMLLNMGGGLAEAAIISSGGIVSACSVKAAGERFDSSIVAYLRQRRNLVVGMPSAEDLKLRIGVADNRINRGSMTVYGRNARTGLPAQQEVFDTEICEAVTPTINAVVRAVLSVLEDAPPEIAGDVYDYGLMLCGGCALMPGLAEAISRKTRLRVTVARHPRDCVSHGLSLIMRHPALWDAPLDYRLK